MAESLSSGTVSTRINRIATMAREHPGRQFRTVHPAVDLNWLHEACRRTRKGGAVGVDGLTWGEYEKELPARLSHLLERFNEGSYYAPPVRRVRIPRFGTARPGSPAKQAS